MDIQNRQSALNLLQAVLKKRLPLDQLALDSLNGLSPQDQNFAKALVITCLRHMGDIDFIIAQHMKKPFKKSKMETQVLRLGIVQLLLMEGVADHAAISTTVDLAKKRARHASGVINGVLRSIQKAGKPDFSSHPQHINIPSWLRKKIEADYGEQADKILTSMMQQTSLNLRWRKEGSPTIWEHTLTPLFKMPQAYVLDQNAMAPTELEGWSEGSWIVQEGAAQVPARLFKGLDIEGAVLDACAAPGGKTVQLFDYLPKRPIIAADINAERLKKVTENLERCFVGAATQVNDATKPTLEKESLAGILLDVPCSATGTTRRHPDVFHTRTEEGVQDLLELQKQILKANAPLVKTGGLLVYSTCSLLKEESEQQVANFLAEHGQFERVIIQSDDLGVPKEMINENGEFRSTPDMGIDGFFAALLRRK